MCWTGKVSGYEPYLTWKPFTPGTCPREQTNRPIPPESSSYLQPVSVRQTSFSSRHHLGPPRCRFNKFRNQEWAYQNSLTIIQLLIGMRNIDAFFIAAQVGTNNCSLHSFSPYLVSPLLPKSARGQEPVSEMRAAKSNKFLGIRWECTILLMDTNELHFE